MVAFYKYGKESVESRKDTKEQPTVSHIFHHHNQSIAWFGNGVNEKCIELVSGKVLIEIDENFYRPAEVNTLLGDSTKAREQLGWKPNFDIEGLVRDMCAADWAEATK